MALSNSTNDIDDIGRHLLNPKFELAKLEPTQERIAIKRRRKPNKIVAIFKEMLKL